MTPPPAPPAPHMNQTDPFHHRTALVTGGARGIGRACCLRLAAAGAKVAVNFRSNTQAAHAVVEEIRAAGGTAAAYQADVACADEVAAMVGRIAAELGPVELLVNNAGVFDYVSHTQTTPELWRRTLEVNLTGAYHVTWAVKPEMIRRRWGRIVNISSISALRPRPMAIAYATSKAGLIAFTQSLAEALAPEGIRINAVAPGLIDTEILGDVDPAVRENIVRQTPLGRIGRPEDVAGAVMFLLSDEADFITGQTLVVCGGRVMLP